MKVLSEKRLIITPHMMNTRTPLVKFDQPRSNGLHISAILKLLAEAAGELKTGPSPFDPITPENYPLLLVNGVIWEECRASQLTYQHGDNFCWQPFELCRDGIYGTPDGIIYNDWCDGPDMSWECKFTTKKAQSIKEHWMYLRQSMCYAAMGLPRIVQYDVQYMLGDYSRPYQPFAVQSIVEFSESEIEAWWKIMLKTSQHPRVKKENHV